MVVLLRWVLLRVFYPPVFKERPEVMKSLKPWLGAGLVILALLAFELDWFATDQPGSPDREQSDSGSSAVAQAFARQQSDVWLHASGEVVRLLSDDNEGDRHQRFIVDVGSGQTVLIAHNIDLAPRVPVRRGSDVHLYGEYEWNPQGGVIHWTHHDPSARRPGGWIDHEGQRYR